MSKKTLILTLAGIVFGAIAGYIYWNQIGCSSGQCMITSKWTNSTIYGGVMGGLLLNIFADKQKK